VISKQAHLHHHAGSHRREEKETTNVSLSAKDSRWVCLRVLDDDIDFIPAHRLKKSWVEDHKIRSKWKAQMRREGLTQRPSKPVEGASNHAHDGTNADSESGALLNHPDKSPVSTPCHDRQSLRHLRRVAYAPKPLPNPKVGHSHNDRGGKATVGRQPNMKLRMNVLLEKIKRDSS